MNSKIFFLGAIMLLPTFASCQQEKPFPDDAVDKVYEYLPEWQSIFFAIIVFLLRKLIHDLKSQADHIHNQAQQAKHESEQCQSFQQHHSTSLPSPSGSGKFPSKKFRPRYPALFHVGRISDTGLESMTTNDADSAFAAFAGG